MLKKETQKIKTLNLLRSCRKNLKNYRISLLDIIIFVQL